MAPMSASAAGPERKKKRPPTFQHFPKNRAAKLKKEWVEKQMIRSKWKAQKRKEGLNVRNQTESREEDAEESNGSDREPSGNSESVNDTERRPETLERIRTSNKPNNSRKGNIKKATTEAEMKTSNDAVEEAKSSAREMRHKAFSSETLHTYKSDPLHRRKGTDTRRGAGQSSSVGRGRGGRGQPNMKYRMEAVLERIKRDFT